ncbi:MAG: hypothetical protein V2A53_02580 [bacterium]
MEAAMRAAANRALSPLESSSAGAQNDKEKAAWQRAIEKWGNGIIDSEIDPQGEKEIAKAREESAKSEKVIKQLEMGKGFEEKLYANYTKLYDSKSDSERKKLIKENEEILAEMEKYPISYSVGLYAIIFEIFAKELFQQSIKDQTCARFNAKSEQAEKVLEILAGKEKNLYEYIELRTDCFKVKIKQKILELIPTENAR